jgi:hypothetical protein
MKAVDVAGVRKDCWRNIAITLKTPSVSEMAWLHYLASQDYFGYRMLTLNRHS